MVRIFMTEVTYNLNLIVLPELSFNFKLTINKTLSFERNGRSISFLKLK